MVMEQTWEVIPPVAGVLKRSWPGATGVPANSYQLPPFLKASSFERYKQFGYFSDNSTFDIDISSASDRWPYFWMANSSVLPPLLFKVREVRGDVSH